MLWLHVLCKADVLRKAAVLKAMKRFYLDYTKRLLVLELPTNNMQNADSPGVFQVLYNKPCFKLLIANIT